MVDYSFIRLKTSIKEAQDLQESPFVTHTYLGQIQLLPFDSKPYAQVTCLDGGVSLSGTVQVYLVDSCGNEDDISDFFLYEDLDNGQIRFQLHNLPKDYYSDLVYLKITSNGLNTYYSNKFKVTKDEQEFTSRVDYKDITGATDLYNAIRLCFYYKDHVDRDDVESYLIISEGQYINTNTIHSDLIEWIFEGIDSFTHKRLKRAIQKSSNPYINFISNQSADPFEYEGRYERSNISTTIFLTDPDEGDVLFVEDIFISTEDGITWDSTDTTWDSTIVTFDNI